MSITAYHLPGDRVRPEGITLGPDGTFFAGSSADGTLYRCALDQPIAEIWSPAGTDERTVALGLTTSPGLLIVCGGKTGDLFLYDVASRTLVSRRHVDGYLNDVCVIDNHAYATDSSQPIVWRFDLHSEAPPTALDLPAAGPDAYLNGIVPTADNTALLIAAQGTELLLRLDLTNLSTTQLATDFAGDGLLLTGNTLIAVCNEGDTMATAQFFLAALTVSPDGRTATPLGRHTDPAFDTPTTLTTDGNRLLIVNAQLAKGPAAAPPYEVIAIPLPDFAQ
ncbi:SMP-30/gluconolactonase/LRE family protein [Kribbella endophytica]